jgi:hypothetical protein
VDECFLLVQLGVFASRFVVINTLAAVRESREPETTGRNLRLIREARERRKDEVTWARKIEKELGKRSTK